MTLPPPLLDALLTVERRLTGPGGPFELEALANGARRYKTGAVTLADLYRRTSGLGAKVLAICDGRRLTYAEIFEPARQISATLRSRELRGQRVGLCLRNKADWLKWFVALTSAGCSCVLVPEGAAADLAHACLRAASVRFVVSDMPELADTEFENLLVIDLSTDMPDGPPLAPDQEALIVFSSGSTGTPKGMIHRHRSLMTGHRNMMLAGILSNQMLPATGVAAPAKPPAIFLAAPLSYIAGYSSFLLAISTGGFIVADKDFSDVASVLDRIEAESLTSITGASEDFLRRLVRSPGAADRLKSLRQLQLHGAALQSGLVKEIGEVLPEVRLMTGYGMSETSGSVAAAPVACVASVQGLSGRLLPSVDLRIVGPDGQGLAPGGVGYVEVRGDMQIAGYLNADHQAAAFTVDGWLRTGDMGSVDADGWLRIAGREAYSYHNGSGDAVNLSGLEAAIRGQGSVDDVVIMPSNGAPGLLIVLQTRPGRQPDRLALEDIVRRTADDALPMEWREVAAFPRTVTGKIDRARLLS